MADEVLHISQITFCFWLDLESELFFPLSQSLSHCLCVPEKEREGDGGGRRRGGGRERNDLEVQNQATLKLSVGQSLRQMPFGEL